MDLANFANVRAAVVVWVLCCRAVGELKASAAEKTGGVLRSQRVANAIRRRIYPAPATGR